MADETGQPYAYTRDDPVNAVDPDGLDCGIFSFACSAYDSTAGGVKTAAVDTGHFASDPRRWRAEANYLAGVGNGIVSTVTFGQAHVSEPYCGSLSWAYGVGSGFGYAGSAVGGGEAVSAIRGALAGGSALTAGGVFDASGELTDQAIADSRRIIAGSKLANQGVIDALTSDGSDISDWGKYATRSYPSPTGTGTYQVHFYFNESTGAASYLWDYKTVFGNGAP